MPGSRGVMPLSEVKDNGQVRLETRRWAKKTLPKKREKSLPPTSLELNVLKCQAAQAKMIIARTERNYQELMDALSLAEDSSAPKTKDELLAREIEELQRRKAAALNDVILEEDDFDDDDDDDSDDDDDDDKSVPPVPEARAVTTPPPSDDVVPAYARPLSQRKNPWDVSIAEPVVMDALLRHQDKAFQKIRDGSAKPEPPPEQPLKPKERPRKKNNTDDGGALFVLNAVEHGLRGFAPYLFDCYSQEQNTTPTNNNNPPPRRCPYADVDDGAEVHVFDPHSLEAKLTTDDHTTTQDHAKDLLTQLT